MDMAFQDWDASPKVKLGPLGAEPPMNDLAEEFQRTLRHFAETVMRPIGAELDKMEPADVIGEGSPLWALYSEYAKLGINVETIASMEPETLAEVFPVILEELGWGDAGLGVSCAASMLPTYISALLGRTDIVERYKDTLGCWGITEPDRGSDSLDPAGNLAHPRANMQRPNCVAKISDGKITINGQKSAWVSNGPVAGVSILFCAVETSSGFDPASGAVVIVPLDADGVSRGKNLHKLGQRALPQGEIFFDNVEVDIENMIAGPEDYKKACYMILTEANALMGSLFTGCGRAAYDHAYTYAHERRQGGVPIIRHQDVSRRIFHMARRVEISCALSRRVIRHNLLQPMPALQASIMSKVTATQNAFDIASDAVQIFGGNGLTAEYPVEKIMRDARSSMIEDGCNDVLAIKGGACLTDDDLAS
jgi:acyl-CoA dehydrogenase